MYEIKTLRSNLAPEEGGGVYSRGAYNRASTVIHTAVGLTLHVSLHLTRNTILQYLQLLIYVPIDMVGDTYACTSHIILALCMGEHERKVPWTHLDSAWTLLQSHAFAWYHSAYRMWSDCDLMFDAAQGRLHVVLP